MKDFAKKRQFLDERVEPSLYGAKQHTVNKPSVKTSSQSQRYNATPKAKVASGARKRIKLGPWLLLLVIILILGSAAEKAVKTYNMEKPANWHEFIKSLMHKSSGKKTNTQSQSSTPENTQPTGPTFDFYTVLPGQSNAMPTLQSKPQPLPSSQDDNSADTTGKSIDNPAVQIKPQYLLVVNAYKTKQQANDMRSRLNLMNITAHVTEAMVHDKMVYRVELGPYDSKDEANSVREQIQQQGVFGATIMATTGTTP